MRARLRHAARTTLLFALLCVASTTAYAETEVAGTIREDTRWIRADDPYVVIGNIIIAEGVTLTIDPGVTVRFSPMTTLVAQGSLVAEGTEASPIMFTKKAFPSQGSNWGGIRFASTGGTQFDDATNRIGGSILKHVRIHFANQALTVTSAGLVIENCLFENNRDCIRIESTRHAFIRNNMFRNNLGSLIMAASTDPDDGGQLYDTRIIGNHFHADSAGRIVLVHPQLTYLEFGHNHVTGATTNVLIGGSVPGDVRTVHVHHNLIEGGSNGFTFGATSSIYNSDLTVNHMLVENNIIVGAKFIGISDLASSHARTQITNNAIIDCELGIMTIGNSGRVVRANTFIRNTHGIHVENSASDIAPPSPIIYNTFAYNTKECMTLFPSISVDLFWNDFVENS